jgi:hypothetical protein
MHMLSNKKQVLHQLTFSLNHDHVYEYEHFELFHHLKVIHMIEYLLDYIEEEYQ